MLIRNNEARRDVNDEGQTRFRPAEARRIVLTPGHRALTRNSGVSGILWSRVNE